MHKASRTKDSKEASPDAGDICTYGSIVLHIMPHCTMRLAIICSPSRTPDVIYSYTFNYASTIVTKLNASAETRSEYEQTNFSHPPPSPPQPALAAAPSDASNPGPKSSTGARVGPASEPGRG